MSPPPQANVAYNVLEDPSQIPSPATQHSIAKVVVVEEIREIQEKNEANTSSHQ